jgi:filamentous hemagglutinin family protein
MGTDTKFGGGGGAGGYTATGGAGGDFWDSNANGTAGTGGGGGGGAAGNASGSGGGVGIYGQGDNGTAGTHPGSGTVWGTPGGGGSGGADGVGSNNTAQGFGGGNYGGGAGYSNRPGGNGVVTIIWGLNRAYPGTNVGLSGAALLMQAQADLSVSDLSELSAPITLVGNATGSNSQQLFSSPTIAFDGSGDRVTATKVPNLGADFTVEAWVYANAGLGNAVIVGSIDNVGNWGSNGYWALMRGAGGAQYHFQIDGSGYTFTSTAPATGVWQHIAVTRSSGTVRYFIDGVLDSTSYTNTLALTNPSGIVVGSGPNNNYIYNWNGHIQDVRISVGVALYTESFTPPTALLQG